MLPFLHELTSVLQSYADDMVLFVNANSNLLTLAQSKAHSVWGTSEVFNTFGMIVEREACLRIWMAEGRHECYHFRMCSCAYFDTEAEASSNDEEGAEGCSNIAKPLICILTAKSCSDLDLTLGHVIMF